MLADYNALFIIACVCGFFMAWGVGANDVANAIGTSVGAKVITIRQAIIIAAIFEFAGSVLASGGVTDTLRGGIVNPQLLAATPEILIYGMLASLLAAGLWLLIASLKGWPVSTSHSIVGAVIGFALVGVGPEHVSWHIVGHIALSWVATPFIAGVLSYVLFISVQKLILRTEDPLSNAKRYIPYYMFLVAITICLSTLLQGLQHIGLDISLQQAIILSIVFSLITTLIGIIMINKIKLDPAANRRFSFANVEKLFSVLMMFTACTMAFAHGSNDVANAIGPLAAIVQIINNQGVITHETVVPTWVFLLGATGIVLGLATYGHKVIATIGSNITALTPTRGFAAQLATSATVVLASVTGLPISTTQTLVGAILGVGMARGIGALNLAVIGNIFLSWLITLPAGAVFTIIIFFIFKGLF